MFSVNDIMRVFVSVFIEITHVYHLCIYVQFTFVERVYVGSERY